LKVFVWMKWLHHDPFCWKWKYFQNYWYCNMSEK
jgi:hypothetical protein